MGYVDRMLNQRNAEKVLTAGVEDKKTRGSPRKRWLQPVKEDLRQMEIYDWKEQAKGRRTWKKLQITYAIGRHDL